MQEKAIQEILTKIKNNSLSVEDAVKELKHLPYTDLGFAKVDHHREIRNGAPEVIYCEGKATEHIVHIVDEMNKRKSNILATRANQDVYDEVVKIVKHAKYNKIARTITICNQEQDKPSTTITVVTAGTSDLYVAEEAVETAKFLGNNVKLISDVGVAGIHRLFDKVEEIRNARVVVVVAGMEGALASVVSGMVDKPVIAVPTSVGYGASFGGLAALLAMLNSCASGISVVNIDNGFGAGYLASMINKL